MILINLLFILQISYIAMNKERHHASMRHALSRTNISLFLFNNKIWFVNIAFLIVYDKKTGTRFQTSATLQVHPLEYEKSAILHRLSQTFLSVLMC